jgi:fumarate reductase subunit C
MPGLWAYAAQRASAMIMAPLVIVHLAVIVIAARGGLSAAEILARTEGSVFWAAFYGLFVLAAAVHAAIGLRSVVSELTPWRGPGLSWAAFVFGLGLLVLGGRAVAAVTL